MKYALVLLLFISRLHAQELVQNGDFESFTSCPDYVSQIDRATGWSRPTNGTSDYFNACLNVPFSMSVPDNQMGDQAARSGDGYAGFYCFYGNSAADIPNDLYREYVSRALTSPLVPGITYSIEFHVSLSDVSKYAVDNIGALLSVEQPYRADELAIEAEPQITTTSNSFIADKDGWTKISGCFTADSAYAYITIGYFLTGSNVVYQEVPSQFPLVHNSYYYIDDVSVLPIEEPSLGPDIESCEAVTIAVLEPMAGLQYSWNTGEPGTSIVVDTSGTYWVTSQIGECIVSDTIEVKIRDRMELEPSEMIHDFCAAPQVHIHTDDLPAGAMVTWMNGYTNDSLLIDHPGIYSYTATSPDHCPAASSIVVHDECEHPVYFPNAFTPNGDGINDVFIPEFDPWSMSVQYAIYDRWGAHISTPEDDGWSGDGFPIGVYQVQYITEHLFTKKRRSGRATITLIR